MFPIPDGPCCNLSYGLSPFLNVFRPSCLPSRRVLKAGLDSAEVEIAEMKQIQILAYVEVMTFDPVESTSPVHRLGDDRGLCVTGGQSGVVPLLKERGIIPYISLFISVLAHIDSKS